MPPLAPVTTTTFGDAIAVVWLQRNQSSTSVCCSMSYSSGLFSTPKAVFSDIWRLFIPNLPRAETTSRGRMRLQNWCRPLSWCMVVVMRRCFLTTLTPSTWRASLMLCRAELVAPTAFCRTTPAAALLIAIACTAWAALSVHISQGVLHKDGLPATCCDGLVNCYSTEFGAPQ